MKKEDEAFLDGVAAGLWIAMVLTAIVVTIRSLYAPH
jgi:multisubunit Na+/H+ antiporter MnhC subunit